MKAIHTYLRACKDGLLLSCPTGDGRTGVDIEIGSPAMELDTAAGDPPTLVPYHGSGFVNVWREGLPAPESIPFNFGGACDVDLNGTCGDKDDVEFFLEAVLGGETGGLPVADWDNNGTVGDRDDLIAFLKSLSA